MSLKNELLGSKKLSADFCAAIARLDEKTDPNAPLFSAIVRADSAVALDSIEGVRVGSRMGDISTVHDVTLNGLKTLVDNQDVKYVEGARKLRIG